MSKSFFDDSDPDAKPGEFVKCPQGSYKVKGIEWIKTDNSFPVYVPDNFRGIVARIRFIRSDGGTPPVGSLTPGELVLLVKAFGGDVKALPKDRNSSGFLVEVENQIEKSGGEVTVHVKDTGWMSRIEGATMPEGFYSFKVVAAKSNDSSEPVRFQPNGFKEGDKEQKTIRVFFQVTGNTLGKSTIYDGLVVMANMYDAWDGQKNGVPKWKNTPSGARSAASLKMERFIKAYLPYFEHEWEADPTRSSYGIDELENPVAVVMDKAIKEGRSVPMQYKPNKNGNMALDLSTLIIDDSDVDVTDSDTEDSNDLCVPGSDIIKNNFNLSEFAQYIYVNCPGAFVRSPVSNASELELTEAGRTWANSHFPKIWNKANLEPKAGPISGITEETAGKLMEVIRVGEPEADLPWS